MRSFLAAIAAAAFVLSPDLAGADEAEAGRGGAGAAAAPGATRPAKGASPFGLLVGGGFPEGASASLVYRPVPEVRLFAGPAWNYVAWGVQGGVTLVPWHMGISPILSLEVGRYFSADATFLASQSSGIPEEVKPLLGDVSYGYAAIHAGIEIGTRDAFAIDVRAGLSYVSLTANGTTSTTGTSGGSTAVVTFTDPHLSGTIPSVKVGVQLWF